MGECGTLQHMTHSARQAVFDLSEPSGLGCWEVFMWQQSPFLRGGWARHPDWRAGGRAGWLSVCLCVYVCLSVCLPVWLAAQEIHTYGVYAVHMCLHLPEQLRRYFPRQTEVLCTNAGWQSAKERVPGAAAAAAAAACCPAARSACGWRRQSGGTDSLLQQPTARRVGDPDCCCSAAARAVLSFLSPN